MGKRSFIIHEQWLPLLMGAPEEDVGAIIKAMIRYTTTGDVGDVSPMHKAVLDMLIQCYEEDTRRYNEVCEKRREAVNRRWNKSIQGDTEQYKSIQKYTNEYNAIQTDTDMDMDMDMDLEKDLDLEKEKNSAVKREHANACKREPRHKYGMYNNVLLSDTDLEKLQAEFPDDWKDRIERLSEYIESKGAKYKSHLATIRAWARKEKPKKQNGKPYAWNVIDNMDWEDIQ